MSFKRITTLSLVIACSCFGLAWSQTETRWTQLRRDGVAAYGVGNYRDAEKPLLGSKQEAERGGAKPEDLADIHTDLAATYQAMGRYADAEPLDRQALQVRQQTFGPDSGLVPQSRAPQPAILANVS